MMVSKHNTASRPFARRFLGLVVVSLSLSACAERATQAGSGGGDPAESPPIMIDEGPEPQWDNVLVGGVEMSTVDEAEALLAFSPSVPSGIEPPAKVVVNGLAEEAPAATMAMRFETQQYGMFWLIEQVSQTDQKELETLAATCDPEQGCQGTWSLTELGDGTVALAIEGQKTTSIIWLDGSVRLELVGPPESFGLSQAKSVADSLVKA